MSKIPPLATHTVVLPRTPALHPLLAAVVATLPAPGVAWSVEQRVDWLRMADMAARVAYGPCAAISIDGPAAVPVGGDAMSPGAGFKPAVHGAIEVATMDALKPQTLEPHSAYAFYVRADGMVRRTSNDVRALSDECQGEEIYDYRPAGEDGRDYGSLVWADDTTGALGDLILCGPGR